MKFFRRILSAFFILLTVPILFSACAPKAAPSKAAGTGKLSVVATLFPQYDFARQLAGDYADVTLLLPPGAESHSYEPSPSDVIRISNADIFLYTGDAMETWVPKMLSGINSPSLKVIDVSKGISLDPAADHDGHDHGAFDPHIWTSPVMSKQIVQNIAAALQEADPDHAAAYASNSQAYLEQLDALDARFREIVARGKRLDFIFGSRFACHYFAQEYGLAPDSPYDSCSAETEPGAQAMAHVIDHVKSAGIPVIYYQELTDQRVSQAVAEATGAQPLLFHSCHNVSKTDFENGVTYLSLMEQNAVNLEKGLN